MTKTSRRSRFGLLHRSPSPRACGAERLESRTLLSYELVHAFPAVGNDPPVEGLRAFEDRVYFAAATPTSGGSPHVFSSDGTADGTVDLAGGFDSGTFWRYGGPV